jgi:hypothetical protein
MTKLEQKQQELINLLSAQAVDLSMMSKIDFGDDVVEEWRRLNSDIIDLKKHICPIRIRS